MINLLLAEFCIIIVTSEHFNVFGKELNKDKEKGILSCITDTAQSVIRNKCDI